MNKDEKELRISALGAGIFGIGGKVGSEVRRAVTVAENMEVIGRVDLGEPRERIGNAVVVMDFTHPDTMMDNIEQCAPRGIDMVIGTIEFNKERLAWVRESRAANPGVGALTASNFSIGAVLMMRLATRTAPFYPSAEIVELHHLNKAGAPSGASATAAGRIVTTRAVAGMGSVPDAMVHSVEAHGAVVDGIHVHGVWPQGLVAHQEVLLGTHGEMPTIRRDSLNRVSLMPGVLAGVQ